MGAGGRIHSERDLPRNVQGPESAPSGHDDTRWNGVRVHLSTVEGFAGDRSSPGGGGGVDCASVCPICLAGGRMLLF